MPPAQRASAPPATMQASAPPVARSQSHPSVAPPAAAAPATQPTVASTKTGGASEGLSGNWKLKTPVGLVYDFPHIEALRNWLATRESFDGMLASRDAGKSWNPISHWPELTEALPKGRPAGMTSTTTPARRPPSADYARAGTPVGSVDAVNRLAGQRPQATPVKREQAARRTTTQRPVRDPRAAGAAAGARPGRPGARRPTPGARQARQSSSKLGTYAGLTLGVLILLAAILQATGTVDIPDQLGLGGDNPNAPPLYPEPPPERVAAEVAAAAPAQTPTNAGQPEFRSSENWGDSGSPGAPRRPAGPDPFEGRTALELAQTGTDPHSQRIVGLIRESETAAGNGDYDGAIALLSSASQLDRNNPEIICRLAMFHRGAGHYAESDALQSQCDSLRQEARAP